MWWPATTTSLQSPHSKQELPFTDLLRSHYGPCGTRDTNITSLDEVLPPPGHTECERVHRGIPQGHIPHKDNRQTPRCLRRIPAWQDCLERRRSPFNVTNDVFPERKKNTTVKCTHSHKDMPFPSFLCKAVEARAMNYRRRNGINGMVSNTWKTCLTPFHSTPTSLYWCYEFTCGTYEVHRERS